jgi:hypothetical protein
MYSGSELVPAVSELFGRSGMKAITCATKLGREQFYRIVALTLYDLYDPFVYS